MEPQAQARPEEVSPGDMPLVDASTGYRKTLTELPGFTRAPGERFALTVLRVCQPAGFGQGDRVAIPEET